MVAAGGIAKHIHPVVIPKQGERLGLCQLVQPGKGENLAAAVVLAGFVDRVAVGEASGGEVVIRIDIGDDLGEGDGHGGLVDFFE